ncbi:MAG: M23 family metallopeptidase [Gemmatimonadaceae bacterium]
MIHWVKGVSRARPILAALFASGCASSGASHTTESHDNRAPTIVFPLAIDSVRFTSGFGDARGGGRTHHGQDMFCPKWTPILAVVDGTMDWIATARPTNGKSYSALLRGDDGNQYFYDHLNNDNPGTKDNLGDPELAYAAGVHNGTRVTAGQIIGYVGDSGDAEPSGAHLHFELHKGEWANPIDPAPALRAALSKRRALIGRRSTP